MLTKRHKVSERRACRLVGQHRSSNRYEPRTTDLEANLVERMHQLENLGRFTETRQGCLWVEIPEQT